MTIETGAAGSASALRWLLDSGAALDARDIGGHTAFLDAVSNDKTAELRSLAEAGADINIPDLSSNGAVHISLITKNNLLLQLLMDLGADPTRRAPAGIGSPLHYALRFSDKECVRMILDAGAHMPFDVCPNSLDTPLHAAAAAFDAAAARLVLGAARKQGSPKQYERKSRVDVAVVSPP